MEQFEDYLDVSSDDYENFKPVVKFHDYYEEFPTVYGDEEVREPEEEEKKEAKAFVYNRAYDSEGMEAENSN